MIPKHWKYVMSIFKLNPWFWGQLHGQFLDNFVNRNRKTIKDLFIEITIKCFQFELWRAKNVHMFSNWGSLIKFTVILCSGLFIRFTCSLVIRAKCARCGKKSNLLLKPTSHWHRFFQESFVVGKPHPKVAKLKKVFHCCLHLKKVA